MGLFWPKQGLPLNFKGMFYGFKLKLKFVRVKKFPG